MDTLDKITKDLESLSSTLSSLTSALAVKSNNSWKDTKETVDEVLRRFSSYNPDCDYNLAKKLEIASEEPSPELYMLGRIENSLGFILGTLAIIAGLKYPEKEIEYAYFPKEKEGE